MATELDDILKVDPAPEVKEAPKEEPTAEDDTGEKAKSEETEEKSEETKDEVKAETPAAKDATGEVPIAALLDEREKRQTLQKQVDDLKAKGEPEKDFFEDPEGHMAKLKEELEASTTNRFVDLTVDLARTTHEDFDEVMEGWKDVVEANPVVLNQVMASENPGEESYRIAKQYRDMQEIGDPEAYRQKLTEEITAKVLKELEEKKSGETAQSLPESLAAERNVGERKGPAFSGPTPLSEVLATK